MLRRSMSCRRKCWGDTPWEGFFGHIRTIWSVRFLNGCPYQGRRATSGFTPHKTKRRLSSLGESPGRSQAREAGTRRKRIIPTCSARGFSAVLEHDRTRAEETSLWARVGLVCRFQGRGGPSTRRSMPRACRGGVQETPKEVRP